MGSASRLGRSRRALSICKREIMSASWLCLPGMCLARKAMLNCRQVTTNWRTRSMRGGVFRRLFVDDFDHGCVVGEEKDTRITEKMTPHAYRQYNGKQFLHRNMIIVLSIGENALQPGVPEDCTKSKAAGIGNKLRTSEDVQSTGRKDNVPLKTWKNSSHAVKSLRASRVRRTLWLGLEIPHVRSCKRHKKARPGAMARHANVKEPITDKRSRKQTVFRRDKTCKRCTRGSACPYAGLMSVHRYLLQCHGV